MIDYIGKKQKYWALSESQNHELSANKDIKVWKIVKYMN